MDGSARADGSTRTLADTSVRATADDGAEAGAGPPCPRPLG